MSRPMESLQVLNSVIRTILGVAVVGGVGTASYVGYQTYNAAEIETEQREQALHDAEQALLVSEEKLVESHTKIQQQGEQLQVQDDRIQEQTAEITDLNEEVVRQGVEIERLDTALQLHKMQRRLAQVTVLDVKKDPDTGKTFSTVEFVELNDLGDPIGSPKKFELEGDMIYLDYLVVKFDDKYVEHADLERGTSICTFRRLFGEHLKPKEGFTLDEPGSRPGNYAQGGKISELEQNIWDDFWTIANDPARAVELGIRTIGGEAVSMQVQKGKTYRVIVRASGGPEYEVVPQPAAPNDSAT